jgi:hypothetical protein
MVFYILLVIAVVAHVPRLCYPCAARVGAVLNFIAGPYLAACNSIAASVTRGHCFNHKLPH